MGQRSEKKKRKVEILLDAFVREQGEPMGGEIPF